MRVPMNPERYLLKQRVGVREVVTEVGIQELPLIPTMNALAIGAEVRDDHRKLFRALGSAVCPILLQLYPIIGMLLWFFFS